MTKFTEGNWQVDKRRTDRVFAYDYERNEVIPIAHEVLGTTFEETVANARLIAAAPEMYKLLNKIFHTLSDKDLNEPLRLEIDEVLLKVEHSINKVAME